LKVLITYGGTEEPIDGVRTISNFSTGNTGRVIADYLAENGLDIRLLKGKRAVESTNISNITEFSSFDDLDEKIRTYLSKEKFDCIIHLAAVSDFSIDYIESDNKRLRDVSGKIDSSKSLTIHLKPNFKILNRLKEYSGDNIFVIGFKLTKNEENKRKDRKEKIKNKIESMFKGDMVDIIVHNDLSTINEKVHIASIYNKHNLIKKTKTKQELAKALYDLLISQKFKEI
jgi:phosphopantothenoylcysteine synthetase/decarboxylase